MDSQTLNFYGLCGVSAALFALESFAAYYLTRYYARFATLLSDGINAKGKILKPKNTASPVGKYVMIDYEFQTTEGVLQKSGRPINRSDASGVPLNQAGSYIDIVYLQANPRINCPKISLEYNISNGNRASSIMRLLPLFALISIGALWIVFYTNN